MKAVLEIHILVRIPMRIRDAQIIRILRIRIRNTGKKSLKSPKQKKSRFFLRFLLDDGRIRILSWIQSRVLTYDLQIRMRIREAKKHMDPTDLDPDADPQH
jgi:hypothetical protein